jgi:hypothetical protein
VGWNGFEIQLQPGIFDPSSHAGHEELLQRMKLLPSKRPVIVEKVVAKIS